MGSNVYVMELTYLVLWLIYEIYCLGVKLLDCFYCVHCVSVS